MDLWTANTNLRKQNAGILKYRNYTDKARSDTIGPTEDEIKDKFNALQSSITDGSGSVMRLDFTHIIEESDSLGFEYRKSLIYKAIGIAPSELSIFASHSGLASLDILRSLTAASICISVLESQFPAFLSMQSPLLEKYREGICFRGSCTQNLQHWLS